MEPAVAESSDLDNFIEFLYDGLDGYVYVAAKDPLKKPEEDGAFVGEMVEYPKDKGTIKGIVHHFSKTHEVYLAPAIFNTKELGGKKENVKASNVVWIDFDGNAPADWSDFAEGKGPPSYIVQTSLKGRQHVYWRLENPLRTTDEIERFNRSLAYNFKADTSGWDANQVLRPPSTYNHKRSQDVRVLSTVNVSYDISLFESLSPPPPAATTTEWKLSELPDVDDVLLKYSLGPDVIKLLKTDKPADRSMAMQQLAYATAEGGMSDNEIFVILRSIDGRWGKYVGRSDRDRRLADIIVRARSKYPSGLSPSTAGPDDGLSEESVAFAYNYTDFLNTEISIDWVIEGMLMEQGQMMFVGPSGVGKTQFILEAMKSIAIGKPFLGHEVRIPKKVGFLSLEMGHPDLKIFMEAQDALLSPPERDLLDENLTIIPYGEAWPLNMPVGQERLTMLIEQFGWEGLFIDSIGSSVLGDISSHQVVQPLLNYADSLRNQHGLFLWWIHHTRKSAAGATNQFNIDDVYGDQYLVNRASSAYMLLHGRQGLLKVRNIKNRLAAKESDYYIERTPELSFKKVDVPMPTVITSEQPNGTNDQTESPGGIGL